MFDNIGKKIKTLSQVTSWIGIIASVILGIIIMIIGESYFNLIGFLILIFGSLFSWINSFLTYGFGQLIENSDRIASTKDSNTREVFETLSNTSDKIFTLNKLKSQGLITEEEYNQKMRGLK